MAGTVEKNPFISIPRCISKVHNCWGPLIQGLERLTALRGCAVGGLIQPISESKA